LPGPGIVGRVKPVAQPCRTSFSADDFTPPNLFCEFEESDCILAKLCPHFLPRSSETVLESMCSIKAGDDTPELKKTLYDTRLCIKGSHPFVFFSQVGEGAGFVSHSHSLDVNNSRKSDIIP
jgi:hypothetical protein